MSNKWIVKPRPLHQAQTKILCFSYAGGGISVFAGWHKQLPHNVELNIVQPPGRGTHFSQSPIDNMTALIDALLPMVSDILQGQYVVYGHSLGSRVAFELVRQAMVKGFRAPLHFFASGSSGPSPVCAEDKMYQLSDDAFIQRLKNINGTPDEILANRQFMRLLLPTLRADFKLAATYSCPEKFTIDTDVTVLSGRDDAIPIERLQQWGNFFRHSEIAMCDGGHFFIDTHPEQVLAIVNRKLSQKAFLAV